MKKDKLQDDDLMLILLDIPKQSVKIEVKATVIDEVTDELYETVATLNLAEIIESRIIGYEWEGENVKYCLTDEARKELENAKA